MKVDYIKPQEIVSCSGLDVGCVTGFFLPDVVSSTNQVLARHDLLQGWCLPLAETVRSESGESSVRRPD